jgi:hypothetical protein
MSFKYWLKYGNWINEERGLYLKALGEDRRVMGAPTTPWSACAP